MVKVSMTYAVDARRTGGVLLLRFRVHMPPISRIVPPDVPPSAPGMCHTSAHANARRNQVFEGFLKGKRKKPEGFEPFRL